MSKIIRLTESDLIRIVKRVISEDAATATSTNPWTLLKNPTTANIAKTIYDSKGYFNDDEKIVVAAIQKIKDKNMWWQVTKELQKLTGGKGIPEYLNTFLQGDDYELKYNDRDIIDEFERIFGFTYTSSTDPKTGKSNKYPFNKVNLERTIGQSFSHGSMSI